MSTRRENNRFLVRFAAVSFLAILTACTHIDGPYRGKVVELETEKPIEGAVVAARWTIEPYIRPKKICDAKETITDKNGDFELPKGSCFCQPFAKIDKPLVVVFKPGYLGYPALGATQEERKAQAPGNTGNEFKKTNEYSVIKLGKPVAKEERDLTYLSIVFSDDETINKVPILLRLLNEERRNYELQEKKNTE